MRRPPGSPDSAPTEPTPAVVNARLAFRRTADGGVEIMLTGDDGQHRWQVVALATALEWVQGVAGVSAFANGRTSEFVMALSTATHLHLGRHQP